MNLTVDSVIGSEDTYLYYYTLLPKTVIISESKPSQPRSFYSEKEIHLFFDSLSKSRKPARDSFFRAESFRKVDSIFETRPGSKVLPWLIRFYAPDLGMDFMQKLYYRLNTEQQQSETGKDLLKELNKLQLLKPGNVFEDFTMTDNRDKEFHFSSLKSKYVLIYFWASWCGPCRGKHPFLRDVYLKNKGAGFEIISIALDDDKQKWLQAIKQDKLTWINVSDLQRRNNSIALKYKITGIPFSVLLDEKRNIILVDPTSSQLTDFFQN